MEYQRGTLGARTGRSSGAVTSFISRNVANVLWALTTHDDILCDARVSLS